MIFNTWSFAIFGLVTLAVYWALVPPRWRPYYIILAGCVFYAYAVPAYLLLVLALGAITYLISDRIVATRDRPRLKRAWMAAGVTLIVAVLVFFKYTKFFAATINEVAHHDLLPIPAIVVPLAISFFTFEFVHVLVDVYLGKIERLDPLDFSVFTMFFPTLVAGPIKRYQSFAPQVRNIPFPPSSTLALNVYRIIMGLAKKYIIADSMTLLAQPIVSPDSAPFGRLDYIVAMFAYTAKIYFDFTGYSDIAIGLGGLLGLSIPENFDRPYWAQNISEFWRRWHMSLSSWIRDYVFIPLGGSRRPPLITALNLFIAMALAGLWHGAAWTFVVWGLWHGAGLAVHRMWSQFVVPRSVVLASGGATVRATSLVTTFAFVVLGWVLFAATSFQGAAETIARALLR